MKTFAPLVLLILCGCLGGRLPARELYRLTPAELPSDNASQTLGAATIAIAPFTTPGLYGDASIVYRLTDNAYGAYPSREWAIPLSTMLGLLTQDVLRARPITGGRALFDPPSRRSETFIWEGTVREFDEVDRPPQVFAAVRLDARLVRSADNAVVWSGSARAERVVSAGNSMTAVVKTLSDLAAEVVGTLATEARSALARPAVSAGRPPQ